MSAKKKYLKVAIIAFISILLIEVFAFNVRFWESLTFVNPGNYSVHYDDQTVIIKDLDSKIKNIYFKKTDFPDDVPLTLSITFTDEANTNLTVSETEVINAVSESNYIRIYPDGKVSEMSIRIVGETDKSNVLKVNPETVMLELNAVRPFCFRFIRFILMILAAFLLILFAPDSPIYKIRLFDEKSEVSKGKRFAIYYFLILFVLLWGFLALKFHDYSTRVYYESENVEAIFSYQADALREGHVYLNQTPPSYLAQMENPYDYAKRMEMFEKTGETFNLDFAYHNGRYYSYFGIVPTLLFYLPFVSLTGTAPGNSYAVILFGILFITACFRLVRSLSLRLNKDISVGMYFVLCTVLIFGSGVLYCAHTPKVYSVPFISAFCFAVSGIVCWFRSTESKTEEEVIKKRWLIAGSICMGLAIGCRPTFGLFVLLAFPVFAKEIRQKRFFSAKGLGNTLCVMLPVFLIGCGLLYFNYLRFGNIFDFGYKYNLSQTDLAHRYNEGSRVFFGTFEYLFQPLNLSGTFPYVRSVYDYANNRTDHLGYVFFDPMYCGFFILSPLTLSILLLRRQKASLKKCYFYEFSIMSMLFALALMILNIEKTGISMRYQLDFSLLLVIPSVMVLLVLEKELADRGGNLIKIFRKLVLCAVIYTVVINLLLILPAEKLSPMEVLSTELYYQIKYLIFVPR
ncbi:MAG: hypothetical protein J5777_03565 [Clostridiales bacterium]|nr:hypothetical protein [Clostridiales bacterium]